jgi:hypothetical protein
MKKNLMILTGIAVALYGAFEAGEFYNYGKHEKMRSDLTRWMAILVKDATPKTMVKLVRDPEFNKLVLEHLKNS